MNHTLVNLENFLEDKDTVNQLHNFILQEPNFVKEVDINRINEFNFYLELLKKKLDKLYLVKGIEDRKALCHFYLGDLYTKCINTYYASKNLWYQKNESSELIRVKYGLIHYINAMLEANRLSFKPPINTKTFGQVWLQQRRSFKILENNKRKIFLQTILTLTELLNSQPVVSLAIDSLYPKAQLVMKRYIIHAYKLFVKPHFMQREINAMFKLYNNTIFDKLGVDISKAKLKAKKDNFFIKKFKVQSRSD